MLRKMANIHGPDRPGRMYRQAPPRVLIKKHQDAEPHPVFGLILEKVPTPHVVGPARPLLPCDRGVPCFSSFNHERKTTNS